MKRLCSMALTALCLCSFSFADAFEAKAETASSSGSFLTADSAKRSGEKSGTVSDSTFERTKRAAMRLMDQAAEAAPDTREAVLEQLFSRIKRDMDASSPSVSLDYSGWGDLYFDLADDAPDEKLAMRLRDESLPLYQKAAEMDPKNEDAWSGWGEVHFERSEIYADSDPQKAREEAERCFEVYAKGVKELPRSNYLWYMWGSDIALRAYEVQNPERRTLREDAIVKFDKAIEFMHDDEYAWRMAAKTWWRIADDMDAEDPARKGILLNSFKYFEKAYPLNEARAVNDIARVAAQLKDEGNTRKYLEAAAKMSELDTDMLEEADFNFVRSSDWFKALR